MKKGDLGVDSSERRGYLKQGFGIRKGEMFSREKHGRGELYFEKRRPSTSAKFFPKKGSHYLRKKKTRKER